ncbi:MAG: hypothetical protein K8R40_12865 [Anaerolineaceae bacterium]|nr:hypothetical protein [Anaerolineaceae bacterium]
MNKDNKYELPEDAFQRKDFIAAKYLYTIELKTNPESFIYWRLAQCQYMLKEYPEAMAMCKKSLELQPERAKAHLTLNKIYATQYLDSDAEAEARIALELDPSLPDAYVALARAQFIQHDFIAAEENIQVALEKNPEDWYSHYLHGLIFRCTKRQKEALKELKIAYHLNPVRRSRYSVIYQYFIINNVLISIFITSLVFIGFFTKVFPLLMVGISIVFVYGVIDIFIRRVPQAIMLFATDAIILVLYYLNGH